MAIALDRKLSGSRENEKLIMLSIKVSMDVLNSYIVVQMTSPADNFRWLIYFRTYDTDAI